MILHNEYLTDEELELLISETEEDLVTAPPGLEEKITGALFRTDDCHKQIVRARGNLNKKKREFAEYCFRVAMSAAAAIIFVFMIPYLPDFAEGEGAATMQEYTDKETFLKENGSRSRQDVCAAYPSREEVLNDKSMIRRLLDGENIFDDTDKTSEFPEKTGGPGNFPEAKTEITVKEI